MMISDMSLYGVEEIGRGISLWNRTLLVAVLVVKIT